MGFSGHFCQDVCLQTINLASFSNLDKWGAGTVCVDQSNRGPPKEKTNKDKSDTLPTMDSIPAIRNYSANFDEADITEL